MGDAAKAFGPFQLEKVLSASGLFEVCRATFGEGTAARPVALRRLLPPHSADPAIRAALLEEGSRAGTLSGPNLAAIVACGEEEGEPYLATEWLPGVPLAKLEARARAQGIAIPAAMAAAIGHAVGQALRAAAAKGIVHRDVAPENVFVGWDGRVALEGFGLGRATAAAQARTASLPAPHYAQAAPEVLRGEDPTPRSDVFSLGVVLYELLTGHLPFPGDRADATRRILRGSFRRPGKLAALPPRLEDAVARALSPDPADRFRDGGELAAELSGFLASAAPTLDTVEVGQLAQWLFQDDLAAETGKPPELPRELVERIALWKAEVRPPSSAAIRPRFVDAPARHARDGSVIHSMYLVGRRRVFLFAGLALGLALLGMGLVWLVDRPPPLRSQVFVESDPPGAQVWVDGHWAAALTNTVIADLPNGEHTFTFKAAGHREHTERRVLDERYSDSWREQRVSVKLERIPESELPPPPVPLAMPPVAHPPPEPVLGGFSVRKRPLSVKGKAVHLALDPGHEYLVIAHGAVALGPGEAGVSYRVWLAAASGKKGHGISREGFVTPAKPMEVSAMSDLWAFVVDPDCSDNSGTASLLVRDRAARTAAWIQVDGKKNCLDPRPGALELGSAGLDWLEEIQARPAGSGGGATEIAFATDRSGVRAGFSSADDTFGFVRAPGSARPRAPFRKVWFFSIAETLGPLDGLVDVRVAPVEWVGH